MKKIYPLIAILGFTLVFSACKKEAAAPVVQDVTGSWKPDHIVQDYYYKGTFVATETNTNVRSYVDLINFKSAGTGEMIVGGSVLRDFKYEVSDSKIHCSSVFEHQSDGTRVATRSFMYFITELSSGQLAFTLDEFYYSPAQYDHKPVDQMSWHIHLVKQ